MEPVTLAIVCFIAGIFLLAAEVLLPSHGVLGVVGTIGLLIGVGVCFRINQYAGLIAAITLTVSMPFAIALWVKVWPHTPMGKRLILGPPEIAHAPGASVSIGQVGIVISELRPGGVCEFGADRIESKSEQGVIPAGTTVEVVGVVDQRPVVRPVERRV